MSDQQQIQIDPFCHPSSDSSIDDLYCLTKVPQLSHAMMMFDEYRCVMIGIVYCNDTKCINCVVFLQIK